MPLLTRQHSLDFGPVLRGDATLLVIEDSESLRRGMAELASEMGLFKTVLTASDGFEGYRLLRQGGIDIVLCDLQMPHCDGLGFLRLRRRDPRTANVPVIVLAASDDQKTRVQALDAGASDYIAKPAHAEEARARLAVHLKLKQVVDELTLKTAELERLTRSDALTGLGNRRLFDERLADELERSRRSERPLSLLVIDLDHFKRVNDTHGHKVGDEVLARVGSLLQRAVRGHETVARYGGEELAVLLPETDAPAALIVAERIRQAIAELQVPCAGGTLSVTASIGVASTGSSFVEAGELVEAADVALYAAKRHGRNRSVCGSPAILLEARARQQTNEHQAPA